MTDPILLADRVATSIQLGESHFREFKSALEQRPGAVVRRERRSLATDIAEALVAFANADGGELIVGVEDNGDVTGLGQPNDELTEYLLQAPVTGVHEDTPLSGVRAVDLAIGDERVLYFSIPKSLSYVHLTSKGRCLQRRDLASVPIASEEIVLSRRERRSREYDREFVEGPGAEVLDLDLVGLASEQISQGMSPEKCLQYLDLAEYRHGALQLRRAALLLFAREPSHWHPRLQIRIVRVKGREIKSGENYNVESDVSVTGNIQTLIEAGWDALRPSLTETRLTDSARFESQIVYPELACREALVNAIAHRDYSMEGRGIEIFLYEDRLEVVSPGGLLSSLTIEDLLSLAGAHQSRNSLVARVLRETGYMRELGEGMRRMFSLMERNELAPPELRSQLDTFAVVLHHRPVYSPEHLIWLDEFASADLAREEKAIVVLGYGGTLVSPNDIINGLGLVDTERYRQLISGLQKKGILYSEVPKNKAQQLAKRRRVAVRDIPRFKIEKPSPQRTPQRSRPSESLSGPAARLYVGGIAQDVTEEHLIKLFSPFGDVEDCLIPTTHGRRRGFGFVQLGDSLSAARAMLELNGKQLSSSRLVVRPADAGRNR